MVTPPKTPGQRPLTPPVPRADQGNKKFNFKDFREILKSGWRTDTALPAGRPAQNEKTGADGLLLGTPLAEGEHAPPAGPRSRGMEAGVISPCDDGQAPQALLDPLTMVLAPPASHAPPSVASDLTLRTDFAAAVEEIVRRISWGGDRRSGTARIELGRGALEGGAIVVQALGRQVKVELDLPPGFDGRELEDRLRRRLSSRGIDVSVSLR